MIVILHILFVFVLEIFKTGLSGFVVSVKNGVKEDSCVRVGGGWLRVMKAPADSLPILLILCLLESIFFGNIYRERRREPFLLLFLYLFKDKCIDSCILQNMR